MSSSVTDKTLPAPHSKADGRKFWAVVIGIDGYKTSPLRGCISDAMMVAEYLINDLRVPENHIQLLLSKSIEECTVPGNKPPTRANIVNAILDLSTNPDIQHGDNIIIYFAGHGTTYECAEYSQYEVGTADALGNIEALCPIDRGPKPTTITNAPDNNVDDAKISVTSDPEVPDICDREINTILADIAKKKGNHITFIVDCCHSASITRVPLMPGVRAIAPLPSSSIAAMFSAADQNFKHLAGYQSISEASWRAKMDSHVVLAACQDYEYAREVDREGDSKFNGVFTRALISAFKTAGLNDKPMTYYNLIATLPLPKNHTQNPVIAGKHMKSRLWFQDCDNSNIKASSD